MIVIEIPSPHDETYAKMDFYAERAREFWVVDPAERTVEIYGLTPGDSKIIEVSAVLGVSGHDVRDMIEWP